MQLCASWPLDIYIPKQGSAESSAAGKSGHEATNLFLPMGKIPTCHPLDFTTGFCKRWTRGVCQTLIFRSSSLQPALNSTEPSFSMCMLNHWSRVHTCSKPWTSPLCPYTWTSTHPRAQPTCLSGSQPVTVAPTPLNPSMAWQESVLTVPISAPVTWSAPVPAKPTASSIEHAACLTAADARLPVSHRCLQIMGPRACCLCSSHTRIHVRHTYIHMNVHSDCRSEKAASKPKAFAHQHGWKFGLRASKWCTVLGWKLEARACHAQIRACIKYNCISKIFKHTYCDLKNKWESLRRKFSSKLVQIAVENRWKLPFILQVAVCGRGHLAQRSTACMYR